MKKIFLILILLYVNIIYAQTGWFWQNPKPTEMGISDALYVNATTIYALGGYGEFLKSTDGGLTWSKRNIVQQTSANEVFFGKMNVLDAQNIIVPGTQYDGTNTLTRIYKSTDGGNEWSSFFIFSYEGTGLNMHRLKFINSLTGYCYQNLYSTPKFYKTIDGGITWQHNSINSYDTLGSVFFANENTGWVGGPRNIYFKTTNGGNSWNSYTITTPGMNFIQPFFVNANTGWIAYQDKFFRTTNGGINFTSLSSPSIIYSYFFINENTGYGSIGSSVQRTNNSGLNWSPVNIDCNPVNFLNEQNGIAIGQNGRIAKTSDGGSSWNQLSHNVLNSVEPYTGLSKISFTDENYGWALGSNKLLKTTNGGNLWVLQPDTSKIYNTVKFLNQNTGVLGTHGEILLTTNSGANWFSATGSTYLNYDFSQFSLLTSGVWYAFGHDYNNGNTLILKSTNDGYNWITLNIPQQNASSLIFTDVNTGYCSTLGGIYKTTNGSTSWNLIASYIITSNISFIDNNFGWCTDSYSFYKTTNGGINWQHIYFDSYYGPSSMKFVNALTGYITGHHDSNGRIQKTTDGGNTFFYTNYAAYSHLQELFFINEDTGWAVGENGTIVKTTTGGTIGIQQISLSIPDKFYLEQNYPNPFNPNTNIEFSLPQKTFVKLKVFDLLGREVAALVNENLSAGKYKYDFNASLLPSGIYFYKLETENFSETRKMMLVK